MGSLPPAFHIRSFGVPSPREKVDRLRRLGVVPMGKERRKVIVAGSLWMAVQYTVARGGNQTGKREARAQISTPARESLNAKLSWQKLMLILAANFISSDLVVTLTYRDADLPRTREQANKRLDYFIRQLRAERKKLGQTLVAAKITEGYHSGGRLHHHVILNATGQDYRLIRDLWKRNGDDLDFEPFGRDGPERWAKYLTKEPREKGRRYVGDRTWSTTRNVKKPIRYPMEYVPSEAGLSPPPGAFILDRTQCENCYGRFTHIVARLPENAEGKTGENHPWGSV